ncbi:hypothetical protein PCANB_002749 [Pneumocystis canis]|nr:hypothetical protein PCANB_002749 [Pneumocystis canis]
MYFLKSIIKHPFSDTFFPYKLYSKKLQIVYSMNNRNLISNSNFPVYGFSLRTFSNSSIYSPMKSALLYDSSSFLGRLKNRMKYFLMKQIRPFNVDDISAMFTWLIACNVLWIIVGTTTFFSLLLVVVNSVFAQEYLATKIGEYLTKETGITVIFESAIVPKWRDGTISFKNVFVSRRSYNQNLKNNVRKGTVLESSDEIPINSINISDSCSKEDTNYTQFDLTIEDINVVFSFIKWFNGTGIIKDIDIKGVRGVIDSSCTYMQDGNLFLDPKLFRKKHQLGDFEIENFRLKNVLVTVYQSNNFRPFTINIYNCELPRLRKQWLLYDILNANTISGSYDNSLFTLHPCQTFFNELNEKDKTVKKTRLRIDNVNIDHLNRGIEGPFGWITHGYVDFILDFVFPDGNIIDFTKMIYNIVDNVGSIFIQDGNEKDPFVTQNSENYALFGLLRKLVENKNSENSKISKAKEMMIDIKMILHGVKANVPLFTKELSYVSNALIRPIVAYINSHHACIPVTCKVIKDLEDFNGSWTIYDSGLMDDLSKEIYETFAKSVINQEIKRHYIRKISAWSLEMIIHAVLSSLKGIVSPIQIYS